MFCFDLRRKKLKERKAVLIEKESGSGEILRQVDFCRAVSMAWLFQPDILQFCIPVEKDGKVVLGELAAPELFNGQMAPPL